MSRRGWLWMAFAVVHGLVAWLGFVLPNSPMGDVYLVYEPWVQDAFAGAGIVGVTSQWVYPQLAIVPMVLAVGLEWIAGYEVAWAILVTVADGLAFALLLGRGRSAGRTGAAVFWLAFILLLGPVGMYRIDGVTVPLAVAGCLWLVRRPLLASLLLAAATWIKVWPAALIAAALVALRRRGPVLAGAAAVTALTVTAVLAAGGGEHLFGFVAGQTGRGLQVEAPVSAPYLWQAVAGVPGSSVYYDRDLLTFQVTGPGVDTVIALMTPLLAAAVLAILALGAVQAWRGARFVSLFPPLALSLVLALIVFNKVGSPQFLTWVVAPVLIGLVLDRRGWRWPARGVLVAALLTQIVYPLLYHGIIGSRPLAAGVLTARNGLMILLLVWALVRLARVGGRAGRRADTPSTASDRPLAPR